MVVEAAVNISGSKEAVWAVITNIEKSADFISEIDHIEILEKPEGGLIGLRWRETRTLFGKSADAEKQITEAVENEYFKSKAEDGGFVFLTTKTISENGGGEVTLTEVHESHPQGVGAKLMSIPMSLFFKGTVKKALMQDLNDIKAAAEQKSAVSL